MEDRREPTARFFASRENDVTNNPGRSHVLTCSIIIPVFHGGEKFRHCLESAIGAIDRHDEIIVVADGQGDGSWRLAEQLGLRVIKLPVNGGQSQARNRGAAAGRSDLLFFIDADVVVPADAIDRVRTFFTTETEVAALIGSYDDDPMERNFHSQFKNLFHHFVHQNGSVDASTFWGACGAIRRDIFLEIGGYNEAYRSIEDIELGYRLTAAFHKIRLLPDLQVKHLKHWDTLSLIKSDVLDRAAPWTELIWNQIFQQRERVAKDLNLGWQYQASLIASFGLVASTVALVFTGWALALATICGGTFILLQLPFFRFFHQKRGIRFALQALIWRFGYDLYSGAGFCYGSFRFANGCARKLMSAALVKLDSHQPAGDVSVRPIKPTAD